MNAIRIIHWEQYEIKKGDARSPKVMAGDMKFIKFPVKPKGSKYLELMSRPDGDNAYKTFVMLLVAWACQLKIKRNSGIIWSWRDGTPADAEEIGRKMSYDPDNITKHLPMLADIGWIEVAEYVPRAQKAKPVAPAPSAPPSLSIPKGVQDLFDYWNSDNLVWEDLDKKVRCRCPQTNEPWKVSRDITPDIVDNIKQHLKRWEVSTLQRAIDNYHYILTSPKHPGWTYRWSISEFFGRHMPNDMTQFAFYRFLPDNFDAGRYVHARKS